MKKMMEYLVNKINKRDLEIFFGEGSEVKINSIVYSTNQKKFLIDSTLFATYKGIITEVEDDNGNMVNLDCYPTCLELLIQESWKYIGIDKELIYLNKLELKD